LGFVCLEDRTTPALFTALGSDGLTLVGYDSDNPGTKLDTVTVTGLDAGATLVGIDFRPSNGKLYGVASNSRLYTLEPGTGAATAVGPTFAKADGTAVPLTGAVFGVDFNPSVDKLRIISDARQNIVVLPDTGVVAAVNPAQVYDATQYEAVTGVTPPPNPQLVATAYTNNLDPAGTKTVATQYVIDSANGLLSTQGGPDGDPSPNTGTLFAVDKLGFTPASATGFDIQSGTDLALITVGTKLYTVSLTTAATLATGTLPAGANFRDIAIRPPATGDGTVTLPAATLSFNAATRGPLAVTVTRTGGTATAATVNFATGGGTAVAGVDYLPASGTLNFAPGQSTAQIVLVLPATVPPAAPARTFDLTLSNPSAGLTLGTTTTATVTIPAVTATPVPAAGKFFAVGAGVGGGPRVNVYDAATGGSVGTFFAYEDTFRGGVTVAVADVNSDGVDDILVGSGPGGGPRIRAFDGATVAGGSPAVLADFFAYESSFRGGVNVAAGDTDGDGIPEILAGAGNGGGPRIRIIPAAAALAALGGGDPTATADFFAYEESFRGGVTVASGELTGDNRDDIVAGSGVGGGPRVRVFDATAITGSTPVAFADFFAYDSGFRNGVNVATGTVRADGTRSILTGVGNGGGPNVRVFGPSGGDQGGFFAFAQTLTGGVRVAATDFGNDGIDDILTSSGPGGPPRVRLFNATGGETAAIQPRYEESFIGGLYVG
jgi:hypothetical protein